MLACRYAFTSARWSAAEFAELWTRLTGPPALACDTVLTLPFCASLTVNQRPPIVELTASEALLGFGMMTRPFASAKKLVAPTATRA